MLVPFNLTALTSFIATTLVYERCLTDTPLLDIITSLIIPPHAGSHFRWRRWSSNKDVLNSAEESRDLPCTDTFSPITAGRWRSSSCRQRRTVCPKRSRVLLEWISSTSQTSCQARRRTAPWRIWRFLLIKDPEIERRAWCYVWTAWLLGLLRSHTWCYVWTAWLLGLLRSHTWCYVWTAWLLGLLRSHTWCYVWTAWRLGLLRSHTWCYVWTAWRLGLLWSHSWNLLPYDRAASEEHHP